MSPSQGFGGQGYLFQGKREQSSKIEENRGTKVVLRNREHGKSKPWIWGPGELSDLFQSNKLVPMTLIRKNVLKQALFVLRWLNRSVMTKPMMHVQNQFIHYQIKSFTHDKTLHPRPCSPVTKDDQTVPQWPNHSTATTMNNLFSYDQTVHRLPNRSHHLT